jgi:spore coat protein U-like protein
MKKLLFVAACIVGFSTAAFASTSPVLSSSATLPVQVTLIPAVTVTTVPLNFGTVVPGDGSDAAGAVIVTATNQLPYTILLDGGINPVGTEPVTYRNMASLNGDHIPYTLSSDANRQIPWGDGGISTPASESGVGAVGTGGAQTFFVYGHMDTNRLMPANLYEDTVTITVTY